MIKMMTYFDMFHTRAKCGVLDQVNLSFVGAHHGHFVRMDAVVIRACVIHSAYCPAFQALTHSALVVEVS